jgi:hypothetical protein
LIFMRRSGVWCMSTVSLFFGFLSILVKHVLGIAETFGTINSVSLNPI